MHVIVSTHWDRPMERCNIKHWHASKHFKTIIIKLHVQKHYIRMYTFITYSEYTLNTHEISMQITGVEIIFFIINILSLQTK